MIGSRRADILGLIINHYIKTGEPMGSKTLCSLLPYPISSATIRNEMAYLSDLGFLEQRHTSGGRIPSKQSYRYYVDNLYTPQDIPTWEAQRINEYLSINASDPERLLTDASKLISECTGCASFYSTVQDKLDCIQGVELIPAGNNKAMLVMLSVGGKIRSSVCKMNCPITDDFKKLFYFVMQNEFIGKPLVDVNLSLIQSTAPLLGNYIFNMLPILSSLCSLCKEASIGSIVVNGETNLLSQEELGKDVYKLLTFLASKDKLKQMLDDFANSNLTSTLLIGDENPIYDLKNTVTAIAKFRYNNAQIATLGMLGSLRIDYESVLPRVEYIINTVSQLLKQGGVNFEQK